MWYTPTVGSNPVNQSLGVFKLPFAYVLKATTFKAGNRQGVDLVWGLEPIFAHVGLDLTGSTGGVTGQRAARYSTIRRCRADGSSAAAGSSDRNCPTRSRKRRLRAQ